MVSVGAERGLTKELGNLVFHTSLIGVLVSVAVGGLFGYSGQKVVVEGDSFVNTLIGYDLPAAGAVTLTVFDMTGKVVFVKDQESVKGYNTISVSSKDIPSVGVLYYRLDASEYTATKKMIIIQ